MENPNFNENPVTDQDIEQYYKDKIESLKNGNDEFIIRNFDSDLGRLYDYYGTRQEKVRWLGMVINDYGFGCEAYKQNTYLAGGLQLEEAMRMVEKEWEE